jgi:hypothetical protein
VNRPIGKSQTGMFHPAANEGRRRPCLITGCSGLKKSRDMWVGDFWCGRGREGTRASLPLIGSDGGARRLIHYERRRPTPAARARVGMMPHLRKWRR